jgi:hypothetical protein
MTCVDLCAFPFHSVEEPASSPEHSFLLLGPAADQDNFLAGSLRGLPCHPDLTWTSAKNLHHTMGRVRVLCSFCFFTTANHLNH